MKSPHINKLRVAGLMSLVLTFFVASPALAAAPQSLGAANSFSILSSTYTNTSGTTTLAGDLGYTTPPATAPIVSGTTHVADSIYNQAGIDQGNALASLNSQVCTFNFAPGPIDLATDTTHGPVGVYTPGVYCLTGAANSVVNGNITLTGGGTYIFRMDGALTTGANSIVSFAGGASACDVWWTPIQATTLGANSTFVGSVVDAAGITIGNTVTWNGQALAFGGTVSTLNDTITVPTCAASRATTPTGPTTTPKLPNTGSSSQTMNLLWTLPVAGLLALGGLYVIRNKRKSSAVL